MINKKILTMIMLLTLVCNVFAGNVIVRDGLINATGGVVSDSDTLYVDATGDKVGIGTTNPGSTLEVVGTVQADTFSIDSAIDAALGSSKSHIYATSGTGGAYPYNEAGNLILEPRVSGATRDVAIMGTSGNVRMVVEGGGNVGIGTSSPDALLEIDGGAADTELRISVGNTISGSRLGFADTGGVDGFVYYDHNARKLHMGAGGTFGSNDLSIDSDGKVGIGTTSPGEFVHIEKSAASDDVTVFLKNSDNTDGASDTRYYAQVGGTSGGDPKSVYAVQGSTTWSVGLDNSDSRSFKISTNEDLGTSNKLTIDSDGNVGIGTTSPSLQLDVVGTSDNTFSNNPALLNLQATDSFAINEGAGIWFGGKYSSGGSSTVFGYIGAVKENVVDGDYDGQLRLGARTNGAGAAEMTDMVITSDGKVGIGTTNPLATLQVEDSGATITIRDTADYSIGSNGGRISLQGKDSNGNQKQFASIQGASNGVDSGDLILSTRISGTPTERMRIDKNGKVGIGTSSPDSTLDVNGAISSGICVQDSSSDAVDVSDCNILQITSTTGSRTIGGFANGVDGQVLYVIKVNSANSVTIENEEATGTQKIYFNGGADSTVTAGNYGTWIFYCDSNAWTEIMTYP